jgi:hypothetical protein
MQQESNRATVGIVFSALAAMGSMGTLLFFVLPRVFARRPTYGARLGPGEVKAGEAASRAQAAYWDAEEAASRGQCRRAREHFKAGDAYQQMLERRQAKGDRTGFDIRDAVRQARREMDEKCAV